MNVKKLIVATTIAIAAGSAFAGTAVTQGEVGFNNATYPVIAQTATPLTREQVQAELLTARADGELSYTNATYPLQAQATAPLTRAEVKAELKESQQHSANNVYGAGGYLGA
ncbi:DUF4148 domain-containing protein [Herbaspirillum sp. RTI4]|uniref:DUF4148 domain-containing protein n=1 Tax=Herbaspirillum sp. RTI4 TaxID=3048640 RepID=UPI002AB5B77A|nr:DUF4148 domain-containing protein [Herbaspirillum sp. RTI4]MDY7578422.1 DUF4148 domain-containing protein [Herbaspirillum sp. RTI4]MEA9982564.1 DUF4148 domain-containing protein [Herbaspirillum sp. RTI4]